MTLDLHSVPGEPVDPKDRPGAPHHRLVPAIRLGRRSSLLLALTTAFGVVAFAWPLMIHQSSGANNAHSGDAPWIFVALIPLLLAILLAEISEGAIDAKAVALLGILAGCFAALRVPSPGIDGFEPEWFLLFLSARVLRARLWLRLGCRRVLRFCTRDGWRRALVAFPDAGGGLGWLRSRVSTAAAGLP